MLQEAETNGTRTVLLRIGIVLANDGGALGKVCLFVCVWVCLRASKWNVKDASVIS